MNIQNGVFLCLANIKLMEQLEENFELHAYHFSSILEHVAWLMRSNNQQIAVPIQLWSEFSEQQFFVPMKSFSRLPN
jgi:hypothetical protein